jgi:hypothetical protein
MTDIARRIDVRIMSEPTVPTPKHLFMSLSLLYPSAARAGDAGISRTDQSHRDASQRSQQPHARGKVPGRVTFPSDKPLRVFQGNASARLPRYEHGSSGFMGQHLSLRTGFNAPGEAALLVHRSPVPRTWQDGPQVGALVAIGASNSSPYANITAEPFVRRLDFPQRDRDAATGVPLPILAKDLSTFLQRGPRQGERAIEGDMLASWDIEPPVLSPAGRRAPQHDPTVKASGLPGLLNFRSVNEFGFQAARGMPRFLCPAIVKVGSSVGSADELSHAFRTRKARLLPARKVSCDIRVRARKESSQRRQGVRLIHRGIEAKLVGQVHGCHSESLAEAQKNHQPRPASADKDKEIRKGSC